MCSRLACPHLVVSCAQIWQKAQPEPPAGCGTKRDKFSKHSPGPQGLRGHLPSAYIQRESLPVRCQAPLWMLGYSVCSPARSPALAHAQHISTRARDICLGASQHVGSRSGNGFWGQADLCSNPVPTLKLLCELGHIG